MVVQTVVIAVLTASFLTAVVTGGMMALVAWRIGDDPSLRQQNRWPVRVRAVVVLLAPATLAALELWGVTGAADAIETLSLSEQSMGTFLLGAVFVLGVLCYPGWLTVNFVAVWRLSDRSLGKSLRDVAIGGSWVVLLVVSVVAVPLAATVVVGRWALPLLPIPGLFALKLAKDGFRRRWADRVLADAAPTGEQTAVIEAAIERTGFDRERIHCYVDENDDYEAWRPWVTGIGPFRHVFLPQESFQQYDDDAIEAMLVQFTGRPSRLTTLRILGWGSLMSALLAGFAFAQDGTSETMAVVAVVAVLLVMVAVPVVCYPLGKRLVFRSDRGVAASVGPEKLYAALIQQDHNREDMKPNRIQKLFLFFPSLDERIERLAAEHDDLAATASTPPPAAGDGPIPEYDRTELLGALHALDDHAFTAFVADRWTEEGWDCTVTDGVPGIDSRATREGTSHEAVAIRTIHHRTNDPLTVADIEQEGDLRSQLDPGPIDAVVVVTTGPLDDEVTTAFADSGVLLVDRDDLLDRIARTADERMRSAYPRIAAAVLDHSGDQHVAGAAEPGAD